jgi:fluoroacetyl-CoA thioesterase
MWIPKNSVEIMEYVVREADSPKFLLEKGAGVLSTPRMIELMESTAKKLLDKYINTEKYTSVGIHVDICHKAPAPIGSKIVIRATVVDV